jgi:hypothetical protein
LADGLLSGTREAFEEYDDLRERYNQHDCDVPPAHWTGDCPLGESLERSGQRLVALVSAFRDLPGFPGTTKEEKEEGKK